MKLVIQRVSHAKVVKVETGEVVGKINLGLLVLIGIKKGDGNKEVNALSEKIIKLRIFSDSKSKMNLSISEAGGSIMAVSQFTLYANTSGGNRPSFIDAEEPKKARNIYDSFIYKLKDAGVEVQTGSFGDYMRIEANLDGPVTILLEN